MPSKTTLIDGVPRKIVEITRLGASIDITKQEDGSYKLQKSTNLEVIGIADLKGDTLQFRDKARIAGMPCRSISLTDDERKELGIWTGSEE